MLLIGQKVTYLVILSNFQPLWPIQKPDILAKKYIQGLISIHKFILPVNVAISYFCDEEMYEKCPSVIISVNFDQFLDPSHTLWAPIAPKKYLYGPRISQNPP